MEAILYASAVFLGGPAVLKAVLVMTRHRATRAGGAERDGRP